MAVPLIGESRAFKEVVDAIAMVGSVDSAVLLLGETGTGKEVIAQRDSRGRPASAPAFCRGQLRRDSCRSP